MAREYARTTMETALAALLEVPAERPATFVGISNFAKVAMFLNAAGIKKGSLNRLADTETARSARLVTEEYNELLAALVQFNQARTLENLTAVADAIVDLEYVLHNLSYELGLPVLRLFNEVHQSNLDKAVVHEACSGEGCQACEFRGRIFLRNEHGKIIKPEGWKPPNLFNILLQKQAEDAAKEQPKP